MAWIVLETEDLEPNRELCNYGHLAYLVAGNGVGAISPMLNDFLLERIKPRNPSK